MSNRVLFLVPLTTYLKKETGGVFKYVKHLKYIAEKVGYKVDINKLGKGLVIHDYTAIHIFTSGIVSFDWISINHDNIVLTPVYDRAFTKLQSQTAQLIGNLPFIYTAENIRQKMFRKARVILTFSNFERFEILKNFEAKPNKVRVLGVDYQPLQVCKRARKNFLFIGDISNPRKNLLRICGAFSKVDANLTIVGKSRRSIYTDRLLEKIRSTRNIEYKGKIGDQQLRDTIKSCDALVLVSKFEGFGYAAIEANQNGLPVLGTTVGGTREMLGSNGVYVNPRSQKRITEGIRRVMNGELDDFRYNLPVGSEFIDIMKKAYDGK